jgi:hypothetical protein
MKFLKMDVEKNNPTSEFIVFNEVDTLPHFFYVDSKSKRVHRYKRIHNYFEEMRDFID